MVLYIPLGSQVFDIADNPPQQHVRMLGRFQIVFLPTSFGPPPYDTKR
jgi:hypothetical protein